MLPCCYQLFLNSWKQNLYINILTWATFKINVDEKFLISPRWRITVSGCLLSSKPSHQTMTQSLASIEMISRLDIISEDSYNTWIIALDETSDDYLILSFRQSPTILLLAMNRWWLFFEIRESLEFRELEILWLETRIRKSIKSTNRVKNICDGDNESSLSYIFLIVFFLNKCYLT